MSRFAILYLWLGSFLAVATVCGCEAPEAFHLMGDGSVAPLGSGGDMPGTGGSRAASGGMVGSGGVVGSGGIVATGGAVGTGGAAGRAGRGGTTGGSGGSTGGRVGTTGGRGGSSTGGAGGAASQKILSIDFGVGGQGAPAMAATDMAGVKPARRWNSAVGASGTLSTTLAFSDASAATGAMVTWMSPSAAPNTGLYAVGLTDTTGDGHMMNGYLDPGMAPAYTATITVSGLPAPFRTGGYDVYVYYMAQLTARVTRSHTLTIGMKSFTVSQTGPSPTRFTTHLITADMGTTGDYVLFTNVTGPTFTLTSAAVSATDGAMRAPVNGIQIVWPSGS
jgi:hypothetical protein